MPPIRVVQYGVGPIGAGIVRLMLEKPDLHIVGALDIDPAKQGKDLGEVVEAGRKLGVLISNDAGAVLQAGVDLVVHSTTSYLAQVADQLMVCLRARAHVISTCEELAYPFRKHPQLSHQLDRTAREHKAVLLGTGVNPGFAMDKLVLTLSAACQRVDSVQVRRVVDAARRRLPLQRKVGAGLTVEEFRAQVAAGRIKHHGLPESAAMIADVLGLPVEQFEESVEPVVASEMVRTESTSVPAGCVLGVRQSLSARGEGKEFIQLKLEMYLGAPQPVDAITIGGVPELTLSIPRGIHGDLATAAIVVNCIPAVLEAAPGLRTARDIPMSYFPGLLAFASAR